jgi:hypothetical protein
MIFLLQAQKRFRDEDQGCAWEMRLEMDQQAEGLRSNIIEDNSSDKKILSREDGRPFLAPIVVDVQSIDFEARVAR